MPTLEYTFSIQDQASDKLLRITAASQPLISAVTTVQDKMAAAGTLMNETGGSITALKAQIDALSAERDLLPADGLGTIAQYNERIGELQQKVSDLQTAKPKPVTVPYTFTLNDRVSGGLRKINTESEHVRSAMDGVGQKMKAADALMDATGRSVGALRAKIEALRAEREWIPSDNLDAIREYDKEIKSLGDEIERVERLTSGTSNLSKWAGDLASSVPGIGLLKNPIVQAGAAMIGTAKSAMTFDQNMAQVNITTLLEGEDLENLKKGIKGVAEEFGADAATVPLAFDLINSQINDADKSMNVLAASIKGSKAGFADVNTVASALAQTVSLLGDVDANEVLDVFFASKRMGAVDFSSLAQYLPKLLSTGVGMGIDYKDVSGAFSYLTGKGQSADQATVMLQNAMSMLGKGDVRDKMAKAGVKVFDEQGKMRGMTDIFGDLSNLMNGRSDEERSQLLEGFGIVDKEAKGAFNVLMADMEKYKDEEGIVSAFRELNLLTAKPVIYAANVAEDDLADDGASNPHVAAVRELAKEKNSEVFVISAEIEAEMSEMSDEDREMFLEDLGVKSSGLDKLIQASYRTLGLMSFLTAGEDETRAWTIKIGTKAPQAAGKIHTDFERGFIKAEVVNYKNLLDAGSYAAAREKGLVRMEGKDYVVQDGDVILFRFNV